MAGYKGGADAAVIQAARSAYRIPEGYHASPWDYKGYVNGIANIAGFVVNKVNAASERASGMAGVEEGINKELWNTNNTDFFVDLKQQMNEWSKTMSMSLPFTKAFKNAKRNHDNGMATLTKIAKDQVALEGIIGRVKDCSGPNQSGYNDAALKSLMEEINGDSGMFDNSVRFTEDGIVVMGKDGNETLLEDLQNPASKLDGKETTDIINTQITSAIDFKSKGLWNERNRYLVEQNLRGHLDAQPGNVIGSAAFDYEHITADGAMSFADHLMATSGPYNEAFEEWKNTDGIGASVAHIKETKMNLAQQLWDDNELMKDEYLDWIMSDVLDNQINITKVKKTATTTTTATTPTTEETGKYGGFGQYRIKTEPDDGAPASITWVTATKRRNQLESQETIVGEHGTYTWGDDGKYIRDDGKAMLVYEVGREEGLIRLDESQADFNKNIWIAADVDETVNLGDSSLTDTDINRVKNLFGGGTKEAKAQTTLQSLFPDLTFTQEEYFSAYKIGFNDVTYDLREMDDYDKFIKAIGKELGPIEEWVPGN